MIEKFKVESLATLDDGRIKAAIEQELARCQADCQDRPGLSESRKVTLTITIDPVPDERGDLDACHVQMHVASALPKRKTKVYEMKAVDNDLFFNELSPDNVRQATLDEPSLQPEKRNAPRKVS